LIRQGELKKMKLKEVRNKIGDKEYGIITSVNDRLMFVGQKILKNRII
jgi:hypothetical protein